MVPIFTWIAQGLAFYIGAMLALLAMHSFMPDAPEIMGFIGRCMSGYLALMICAVYGTTASIVLRILNLHMRYGQWTTAQSFKYVGQAMTGVKFEILGNGKDILNSRRPMVIIGNHQTELDILFLANIWPQYCSVTAKKSLKNIPFLGWFMTLSGAIFIDRVDRAQAVKAFDGAATAMKELGQNAFIFPEGTRSYSAQPTLLPFKKGAFHLAVQAGVDILPVVAENYSRVLNIKARRFNSGTIRVRVLDPISTKGLTVADVDRLTTETREKMLHALNELAKDADSRTVSPAEAKKLS